MKKLISGATVFCILPSRISHLFFRGEDCGRQKKIYNCICSGGGERMYRKWSNDIDDDYNDGVQNDENLLLI